jgi:diguanylate cyclase (GGDEF)-like protein
MYSNVEKFMNTNTKQAKILVIDHDLEYVEACRDSLEVDTLYTYSLEAGRYESAEMMLNEHDYACILITHTPETDGFALVKYVHSLPMKQRPAIVMTTRDDDAAVAVQALKVGANDYLSKAAMTPETMVQAVRTAIELQNRQRKEAADKDEYEHMALHDGLTGLANRTLFNNRLEHSVNLSQRNNQKLAILMIDLDGFKSVNDTYGHDAGDFVLTELSGRLEQCLRRTDTLARLGGDEFAILLEGIATPTDTYHVIRRVLEADDDPIEYNGTKLDIGMSVGFAVFPDTSQELPQLMATADHTMYAAKRNGGGFARPEEFPEPQEIHRIQPVATAKLPEMGSETPTAMAS